MSIDLGLSTFYPESTEIKDHTLPTYRPNMVIVRLTGRIHEHCRTTLTVASLPSIRATILRFMCNGFVIHSTQLKIKIKTIAAKSSSTKNSVIILRLIDLIAINLISH